MVKLSAVEKLLAVFILFIAAMLAARISYANNTGYLFLLWNLFLAWVPFQISMALTLTNSRKKWYRYFLLGAWLLFFPNALYIITDLIHLEKDRADVPVWFDAVLIFTSSVAGLIMAFVSLYQVELYLKSIVRKKHINKLIVATLFIGSFGVYLGRFLRWNSWDIVTNPLKLLVQIAEQVIMPFEHYRTWAVTLLLTGLFSLLYFAVKQLAGLQHTEKGITYYRKRIKYRN